MEITEFTIPTWLFNEEYIGRIVILTPLDNRYRDCVSPLDGDYRLYGHIKGIAVKPKNGKRQEEKTLWGEILNYNYLPPAPGGVHVFSSPTFLSEEDSEIFKDRYPHCFI